MKDPIERASAIDVVKRLMGDCELSRTVQTGLHILPSAQPDVPDINDGDMISRQAAIDAASKALDRQTLLYGFVRKVALDAIKNLPSAQPERKKGKWIYGEDDGQDGWYCSECNGFVPWDYEYYGLKNIDFIDDFKVCPFCEADMVSRTGSERREE